MLRQFTRAAAVLVLFAGGRPSPRWCRATYQTWASAPPCQARGDRRLSRTRAPKGNWSEHENERNYRETLKIIPDKKSSNDPWKNVRQEPTVPVDRHQPQ